MGRIIELLKTTTRIMFSPFALRYILQIITMYTILYMPYFLYKEFYSSKKCSTALSKLKKVLRMIAFAIIATYGTLYTLLAYGEGEASIGIGILIIWSFPLWDFLKKSMSKRRKKTRTTTDDDKVMTVKYKGYAIKQTEFNHHVSLYKDEERVLHIQCNETKTEEELKEMVDQYINLFSKEKVDTYLTAKGLKQEGSD